MRTLTTPIVAGAAALLQRFLRSSYAPHTRGREARPMPRQRRTQVIVVGGALAIASAAYGLGTQAGDGNAVAENSQSGERGARVMVERRGPCGLAGLADDLGVDESKLEDALRDFREERADDMHAGFAQ